MSVHVCKSVITLEWENIMNNKGIDKYLEPLINAINYITIKPNR